jgi:hypothetical protein
LERDRAAQFTQNLSKRENVRQFSDVQYTWLAGSMRLRPTQIGSTHFDSVVMLHAASYPVASTGERLIDRYGGVPSE